MSIKLITYFINLINALMRYSTMRKTLLILSRTTHVGKNS